MPARNKVVEIVNNLKKSSLLFLLNDVELKEMYPKIRDNKRVLLRFENLYLWYLNQLVESCA